MVVGDKLNVSATASALDRNGQSNRQVVLY